MALIKMMRIGERLLIGDDVEISLVEKGGRMAVLKIEAPRSVIVAHIKNSDGQQSPYKDHTRG
jgi:sRNA-binding carbon storage regulator CsrA